MYDSIIFDLDGTLWDAVDNILISWNEVINRHSDLAKPITKAQLTECMGLKMDDIAAKLFPYLHRDKQLMLLNECSEFELDYLAAHGARLFDGITEIIDTLSKTHRLFMCSNCQKGYIECFLSYFKLEKYFEDIECWGNTGLSKGENNSLIIKRNHLTAPVYVGDTDGDRLSAEKAGIPFIYAAYGFGQVKKYSDIINTPRELLEKV